eukprot:6519685-Alexandrium_andersonii.AAC.1
MHAVFIDWEKAFDKLRPGAVTSALWRFWVPDLCNDMVGELVKSPHFSVHMVGMEAPYAPQSSGIRQGCTLSPLLFIVCLTVVMRDVSIVVKAGSPLMRTPVFSFCDGEYADDTTLLAKTCESMNDLVAVVWREAE